MQKYITVGFVGIALAVGGYILNLQSRLAHAQQEARSLQLEVYNEQARLFGLKVLWEDSTRVLLGYNQQLDSLVSMLEGRESDLVRANTRLVATIAAIETEDEAPVVETPEGMAARFEGYKEPITYRADVWLQPDTARLRLSTTIDPIDLSLEIGCEPADRGLFRANTILKTPAWLTVDSLMTTQRPEVCNPPPIETRTSMRSLVTAGAVGALAFIVIQALIN